MAKRRKPITEQDPAIRFSLIGLYTAFPAQQMFS